MTVPVFRTEPPAVCSFPTTVTVRRWKSTAPTSRLQSSLTHCCRVQELNHGRIAQMNYLGDRACFSLSRQGSLSPLQDGLNLVDSQDCGQLTRDLRGRQPLTRVVSAAPIETNQAVKDLAAAAWRAIVDRAALRAASDPNQLRSTPMKARGSCTRTDSHEAARLRTSLKCKRGLCGHFRASNLDDHGTASGRIPAQQAARSAPRPPRSWSSHCASTV